MIGQLKTRQTGEEKTVNTSNGSSLLTIVVLSYSKDIMTAIYEQRERQMLSKGNGVTMDTE